MTSNSAWIATRPGAHAPRARLFCFPYAGGSAHEFLAWQDMLGPAIEVCAVQLPGRGARWSETPYTRIDMLVHDLAPHVLPLLDRPYAFFGHSLGALVAFELCRRLHLQQAPLPSRLFASGCGAPQRRRPPGGLHVLPEEAFIETLRVFNGTPPAVLAQRELMALLLPTLRADFEIAELYAYRPGVRLALPVTVLAGRADGEIDEAQLRAWSLETTGDCELHWFDGDHFFVHSSRDAVIAAVAAHMASGVDARDGVPA